VAQVASILVLSIVATRGARPQGPVGAGQAIPTAGRRFRNIQVLKEMPADRVFPSMSFFGASLNVDCGFCHVDGPDFDKDDKKNKQVARKMMEMELAINQANFRGQPVVTCHTCHRGSATPVRFPLPSVARQGDDDGVTVRGAALSEAASEIIEKYIDAIGGAAAVGRISTYVEKGSYSNSIFPGSFAFEAFTKAPGQRLEVIHYPRGDSLTGYGHGGGWTKKSSDPADDMSAAATDYFRSLADIEEPARIRRQLSNARVAPRGMIDGRPINVLVGLQPDHPPMTYCFDRQSGLLVRVLRYTQTPFGPNPVQADYSDYRAVGGIKVPFRRTFIQSRSQYTIQLQQVQENVRVDDAKFVKPM
jgi:photosynthetic reaction center cytochrome c subunit